MTQNITINSNRIGHALNRGKGYWVSQNEDGTLTVSLNGVDKYENAGSLIMSLGGIDATLAACEQEEITAGDFHTRLIMGTIPTAEEMQWRMDFYNSLLQNDNHIGHQHTPVNGTDGFRFTYPFSDIRFDSVKGWQFLRHGCGWQSTNEKSSQVIRCRIHFGLGKAEGNDEAYERVMSDINRENRRAQEITAAYDAIKNLRPIPATIENITAILRYYKEQGCVGELLPMTIGYSCNDYDCDGKYAVAIKLDSPIIYNEEGDMSDRFVCGAPRGHLVKYTRI